MANGALGKYANASLNGIQLVAGEALLGNKNLQQTCDRLISTLQNSERSRLLEKLINLESEHYKKGGGLTYCCSPDLGMTVLTDTTERAPTFGVAGLENIFEETPFSLASLSIGITPLEQWSALIQF